jgi:UPF0755 protein
VLKKLILIFLILLAMGAAVAGYLAFVCLRPAVSAEQKISVRIRSGWNLEKLAKELKTKAGLKDEKAFVVWVSRLGYKKVRPCTIEIPAGCSLYKLAQILKENRYQTVNLTVLGSMNLQRLAAVLDAKIEVNSDTFVNFIEHAGQIYDTPFDSTNWQSLFIPNTYNFAVSTDLKGFITRMHKEYLRFWNNERTELARKQGFTPKEVSTLASIITKESNKTDEYENIAGVYINRLRKGMLLQADPTVAFARGSEGRILEVDLQIQSPYNTYLHKGLPPGPLCIPNLSSLEAVLNYSHHDFLYFVANPDLNGRHHFSKTLQEHELWANKYRAAARELRRKQALTKP